MFGRIRGAGSRAGDGDGGLGGGAREHFHGENAYGGAGGASGGALLLPQ